MLLNGSSKQKMEATPLSAAFILQYPYLADHERSE
jgi:hypothetical protein